MRRIRVYLGDLAIEATTQLIHDALQGQMPEFIKSGLNLDAKQKTLRFGLKGVARIALDYARWQIIRTGAGYPMPDDAAIKADVLPYALTYFVDMILYGLSSTDWNAEYVEDDSGAIRITGLVATAADSGAAGTDDAAGDDEREQPEVVGAENDGSTLGAMVWRGNEWSGENNVGEALGEPVTYPLA